MRKRVQPAARTAAVPAWLIAAGIGMLAFGVYLATLAPDLYSLDSPELTAASYSLGIAHAPGYPLYTLVGWTFSHAFPIGNVAFRFNVLSALFAAGAVTIVYLLAARTVSRPAAAAAGALALAFSYWFWADSLAAEVYTLDVALFVGMLLGAVEWRSRRTPLAAAAVGLLLGLSMATRTTAALYAPALVAFALMSGERSWRPWVAAAAGLALGLAFYLYLPLRSAAGVDLGPGAYALDGSLRVDDLATWSGFWSHVTAADFRHEAFAYGPLGALEETGTFATRLAASFMIAGLPLGLAGCWRLWRADRALLVLLAGTAAPLAIFFINYGALDKEFMFLPVYAAWAVFVAAGIDWMLDGMTEGAREWSLAVTASVLLLPLAALAVNAPLVSLRGEHDVRNDAENFLAGVDQNAIVYGRFTDTAPLQYLQEVEGMRPDVKTVNSWTSDDAFLVSLAASNVGNTPFFLTDDEPVLHGTYVLERYGEKGYRVLLPAER